MTTNEDIRTAQSKVREAYAMSPNTALSTSHASAEISNGLKCVFKQGTETAVMDLPEVMVAPTRARRQGFMLVQLSVDV